MIIKADYDFVDDNIQLAFFLGEIKLFRFTFKGLRILCDIFKNQPVSFPFPPKEEMKATGYKLAYLCSYPVSGKLPVFSIKDGYICYTVRQYKHYYIDSTNGFENYLKNFKSKTVDTLRRKVKKVASSCTSGDYFRVFSTPNEIKDFLPLANEISKKTFQFQLLNQGLQYSEKYINDYLRKAEEGKILGFLLYIENKPIAYNLCPIYDDGVMIYFYTGYDPAYSEFSPGTVLQFKTIETAFNLKPIKKYDMCTGEGKHKELFTKEYKTCADIYYFPLSAKYLIILCSKIIYEKIIGFIKFVIKKLFNVDQIKKWIRTNIKMGKIFI